MRTGFLSRFSQTRSLLRALDRLACAQEAQTRLLERLVGHLVGPETQPASPEDLKVFSGVTFSRDSEQARILDFVEKIHAATGREPTEEEIMDYLDGVAVR